MKKLRLSIQPWSKSAVFMSLENASGFLVSATVKRNELDLFEH